MPATCTKPQLSQQSTGNDMTTWSDDALIQQAVDKGSNADNAVATLIGRHRRWIFRGCLFRLGNHHDAEDATQDVIMRVYANLHQFQGRAKFRTWLNTIIVNYCNTFAVRRAKYVTRDHIEQLIEIHQQAEEAVVAPHESHAEQAQINQALLSLSDKAQQVLRLRFYIGCSLEEIAQHLQLSLSAAKARLYRAIEQFKDVYNGLEDDAHTACPSYKKTTTKVFRYSQIE